MVQFRKVFLLFTSLSFFAQAGTIIPFKAFCYKYEEDCERAGKILRSRSNHPFYAYDSTCYREQNSLKNRSLVNCANGEWKVLFQLRSKLPEKAVDQFLNAKSYPLRPACYRYEYDARAALDLLQKGASLGLSSVNTKYDLRVSYREFSVQELLKFHNQECHDARYLMEYSLSKK